MGGLGERRVMGGISDLSKTGLGVEAQSEAWDNWSWLRGPWTCKETRTWDFQSLGHPGATGDLGRSENRIWALGLHLAWAGGEMGSSGWSHG